MSQPIPKPAGLPLLGNIFTINPKNTWTSLKTLVEEYGEIFQIKVFGQSIVFVGNVALAEELCDEKRFRKYVGGPVVEIREAVHDAVFAAFDNEPAWGIAHRILAPKLQPETLKPFFEGTRDVVAEFLDLWKASKKPVNTFKDLYRLNLETTTLDLYGKRLHTLTGPEHPMLQAMEDSTQESILRPTRPGLLNRFVYGSKFSSSNKAMRDYGAEVVAYRREHPTDRDDLLAAMLNARDPQTGKTLTESQVIDEIVSMPIGSSTSPAMLASAMYYLDKNPRVVAEARKELDAVVGNGKLTYAHIKQLKYIEAIEREALRLSFSAPGFNVEPIPSDNKAPVLLAGGKYQVPHDQVMIIVLAGVNRDPSVFEDPLAFKPERMLNGGFEKLPLGARRWFGNGKRSCIGIHYAWLWNMTVLAMMLREVDFKKHDPAYELKQDGWFAYRPVDFEVDVKARKN